jgi:hypothetical protein
MSPKVKNGNRESRNGVSEQTGKYGNKTKNLTDAIETAMSLILELKTTQAERKL